MHRFHRAIVVKMGTTVATNALLETRGDGTVPGYYEGLVDALRIGYQYVQHSLLADCSARNAGERVIEVEELHRSGEELIPANIFKRALQATYDDGSRAICLHARLSLP